MERLETRLEPFPPLLLVFGFKSRLNLLKLDVTMIQFGQLARDSSFFIRSAIMLVAGVINGLAWTEAIHSIMGLVGTGLFLYIQANSNRLREAIAYALVFGITGYSIGCNWMLHSIKFLLGTNDILALILFIGVCVFQAQIFVLFSIVWHYALKRNLGLFAIPAIWFGCEQIYPGLFPSRLGHLLVETPLLCQIAEIGGQDMVSIFAVLLSMGVPIFLATVQKDALPRTVCSKPIFALAAWGFFVGTILIWSHSRAAHFDRLLKSSSIKKQGVNVCVVQAETENASSHAKMLKACRAVKGKADLIVWPECAIGNYDQSLTNFSDRETIMTNSQGFKVRRVPFPDSFAMLLAGGDSYKLTPNEPQKNFVSAFLLDANSNCVGRHDKIELMPYGEYIPAESWLPFLRSWFGGGRIISRGEEIKPLGEAAGMRIGTVICCEDMFPSLTKQLARKNANLMISIGNGMAFNSTSALRQHFRISRLRSIETRKFFVRCASKGVSAVVNPNGEIVSSLPEQEDGAMLVRIPNIQTQKTVFVRLGGLLNWFSVLGFLCLAFVFNRSRGSGAQTSKPTKRPLT